MPYQIGIESNGPGVVISFSGVVTGVELIELNGRFISEES